MNIVYVGLTDLDVTQQKRHAEGGERPEVSKKDGERKHKL